MRQSEMEKNILKYWEEQDVFQKLREKNRGKKRFVFLEGPPTANGRPHVGHALTRAVKDVFLRYKAMCGYDVQPWIAGWDCHGLPVEIEVEKSLGINSKKEIENYGVARFNKKCRESVFRYRDEWVEMSRRIGFWIDYENAYITMEDYYIESVWWALREIWKKGLLVKDYKVVPYCPRCGTPLSSHEVAQGYRDAEDPSIYVKFKCKEGDFYFLVWTTTPWTLPSNLLLAVGKDIEYALVEYKGEKYYVAKNLAKEIFGEDVKIEKVVKGEELVGLRYEQLIPFVEVPPNALRVVIGDFVSTEEGTGIVHIAPAFGAEDYELCKKENVPMVKPVDEEGKFTETPWKGLFVKDADEKIIEYLEKEGKLFKKGKVVHTYPFCWRCDTPLLYYALDTWFIKMSKLRDSLLRNNEEVNWYPSHLKYGRFGNFLDEVKDWALSRNRYWGTPLPIWTCKNGHVYMPESKEDLLSRAENVPEDFELHRPWVDELRIKCEECGEYMTREPYLIDVWFDSGSAFFAQFHYPYENREEFEKCFPVDFICEAIDQTRGWFYTLMAVSTLLFDKAPYRNVLTLGLVVDEKGEKMSKSRGNVVDAMEVMEKVGADAVRLYFYSTPVWRNKRFSENIVREYYTKTIGILLNVFKFYDNNAKLDNYDGSQIVESQNPLDRWIISRLNSLIKEVRESMDRYSVHTAVKSVEKFIDDLSNWYVRRSRRRFWKEEMDSEKIEAYSTLYTVLLELSKLLAPFIPFTADYIYLSLKKDGISVHLEDYPVADEEKIDEELMEEMEKVIRIVEAGRNARQNAGIKVRQPLPKIIALVDKEWAKKLEKYKEIIEEELNVKEVVFSEEGPKYEIKIHVDFSKLGPRFKGRAKEIADKIMSMNAEEVAEKLEKEGKIIVDGEEITEEEVKVEKILPKNISWGKSEDAEVFLDTTITEDLMLEGLARDFVRRVQTMRKDMNLEYDQRIETYYLTESEEMKKAIIKFRDYIMRETLSVSVEEGEGEGYRKEWKIGKIMITIRINPLEHKAGK